MKIILTNWVNILGVFTAVFLYSVIYELLDPNVLRNLLQSILTSLILICLYGIMFWIGFILTLVILDSILIVPNPSNLKLKLIFEWIIISSPFVYWAIKYENQRVLYIVAIAAFLATQLIRERYIIKALD